MTDKQDIKKQLEAQLQDTKDPKVKEAIQKKLKYINKPVHKHGV